MVGAILRGVVPLSWAGEAVEAGGSMMTTSPLVFERLRIGITREMLAAASGLSVERLRLAEDRIEPLSESEEGARRRGLRRLMDEAQAGRPPSCP